MYFSQTSILRSTFGKIIVLYYSLTLSWSSLLSSLHLTRTSEFVNKVNVTLCERVVLYWYFTLIPLGFLFKSLTISAFSNSEYESVDVYKHHNSAGWSDDRQIDCLNTVKPLKTVTLRECKSGRLTEVAILWKHMMIEF